MQRLPAIGPDERLATLTISHWGAQNGIPEETLESVLAPGEGYVWLSSNHGLVRFDGRQAQVFRLGDMFRPKGTGSCSTSTLSFLLLARDGQIWSGANSGCLFQITLVQIRFAARRGPGIIGHMKREPVESRTMRSVGYELRSQILEIEFQSGAVYEYLDVPRKVHEELMSAESKGQYFNSEIRDDYEFVRIGKTRRAAGN